MRTSRSRSRSAAAPAPTSAARRRRSSTRSRGFAASRATSRRSRSRSGCSAIRRSSTTSRRSSTCWRSSPRAAELAADRHRAVDRDLSCSASPARSPGRASTRSRSARRSANCSRSPAASGREGAAGGALGGAAGTFVGPDHLDLPLTLEDARAASATLGSGPMVVLDETVALGRGAAGRGLLSGRVLRAVHAVPGRDGPPGGGPRAPGVGSHARHRGRRAGADQRARAVHARLLDLRARPDGLDCD